jgi:hypothetical protein
MISYAGRNPTTLNFLKTLYFDSPAWTPVVVSLMPATWPVATWLLLYVALLPAWL